MSESLTIAPSGSDEQTLARLAHERIDRLEDRVDGMDRRLTAMDAKADERERVRAEDTRETRRSIEGLASALSVKAGAEEERNRIAQEQLIHEQTRTAQAQRSFWQGRRQWQGPVAVIGILCTIAGMVGGSILSSQTWDDWLFGNVAFLHHQQITVHSQTTNIGGGQ